MTFRFSKTLFLFMSMLILLSCSKDNTGAQKWSKLLTREKVKYDPHTFPDVNMEECEDFAILLSASKVSKQLKKSKTWVVQNYQIPLYADSSRASRKIGAAAPGDHCLIIKSEGTWFFIQSPGNNALGWLDSQYVSGFMKMNPKTLIPCPGS